MRDAAELRKVLHDYWGYDSFRPCQQEIIESVLDGNDTLGLMPTGGGKSITFQVPAMLLPGVTLVVTPLISLMKDQVDNLRSRGIKAMALHSGLTLRESRVAYNHCEAGKVKLLYVSPEKLQSATFLSFLRRMQVSLIVVDEAHCISQWGYDFRPSYTRIACVRREFHRVPVLALTASATPDVVDDIMSQLEFRDRTHMYRLSFSRENLSYIVRYTDNKDGALQYILSRVPGTAIVYVRSRKRTKEISDTLRAAGISAECYHAGLMAEDKADRQNRWKSGATRVIVATNAFGMGIDKPDVRIVIHYDIPPSLEEYYQEAGRAGRDGKPAYAVTLASKSDKAVLSRRLSDAFPPKDYVRDVYGKACVFLDIAMGEGYETLHEFNFRMFCERYRLQPVAARSALAILSRAGYMDYNEEYNSRSRLMVVMDKHELYGLSLSPEVDKVFQTVLRSYTGIFADYEYISEPVIATRSGLAEQAVYEALLSLARQRVIHYIPRSSNPVMLLTTSREEVRDVVIPRSVYEERRDGMKRRIEAMKRFVFDTDGCRVNTMLDYFGEKHTGSCGKCDCCRGSRRQSSGSSSVEAAVMTVLAINSPIRLSQLISDLGRRDTDVVDAVRKLSDDGLLIIDGDMVSRG